MPNIPQINIGGTVYKIKDAELREQFEEVLNTHHNQFIGAHIYLDQYIRALDVDYNSSTGVTTITKNKDFLIYGSVDLKEKFYTFGTTSGADFKFPANGITTNLGGILLFVINRTTTNAELINTTAFRANLENYYIIGYIYKNNRFVGFGSTELLFNSLITNNDARNSFYSDSALKLISSVCNTMFPIRGKIVLDTIAKTISFDSVMLYPTYNDEWTTAITQVIDFSGDTYPDHLKAIFYNTSTGILKCYSVEDETAANKKEFFSNKSKWALICCIYNNRYIWTSACQSGIFYIGNRDIYSDEDVNDTCGLYKIFKRVGVIGDSLSVGYMHNKSDSSLTRRRALEYSWPKCVMRDAGVPWLNFGTSGQTVLTWLTDNTYGKVQTLKSGNKCQAYIIGLGENDQHNHAVPLGTVSNISEDMSVQPTTYYGGYARIIQTLKAVNPNCKVFCLTNPNPNENRDEYNAAVRYIAGTYYTPNDNVHLVDLRRYTEYVRNSGSLIYQDGANITSHYSPVGYRAIANVMESALDEVIARDKSYFTQIAFIPYDTTDPTADTMTE